MCSERDIHDGSREGKPVSGTLSQQTLTLRHPLPNIGAVRAYFLIMSNHRHVTENAFAFYGKITRFWYLIAEGGPRCQAIPVTEMPSGWHAGQQEKEE